MTTHHNLRTVVGFEVRRTVTKRRYWMTTLIVPVLIIVVFALIVASRGSTISRVNPHQPSGFSFAYHDASGLVDPSIASKLGARGVLSVARGVDEVKSGRLDAFFSYPSDPVHHAVHVYAKDVGVFDNTRYDAVATSMLQLSAELRIGSPALARLAQGAITLQSVTYHDGSVSSGWRGTIPPLLFLVVFYVVIVVLGNQMLNSTLEEKENRVTEMILTTMNPNTLITGKILSLLIAGVLQMAVFMSPVILGYVFFRSALSLPSIDLSNLVFSTGRMVTGALLLLGGFTLFTGTLVGIGALMPTAKDAGAFFAVLMTMIVVPIYIVQQIVSHPGSLVVQVFTYLPFTAPITDMVRNAFGSLSTLESVIVVVELFAVGLVAIRLAIQFFRYGATEYARKVSIRAALGLNHGPRP